MRKIHLNVDELQVTSFQTTAGEAARRGTVLGKDSLADPYAYASGRATCQSMCSWTNGLAACLTCGACCTEDTYEVC